MGIELPGTSYAASLTEDVSRMDIYNRLLKDRIVFLGTDVNDEIANFITAQMLHLESQDPERDIWLYINSPGGSVTAGMAIYDTCLLYTSPSPRDKRQSRMPSSA